MAEAEPTIEPLPIAPLPIEPAIEPLSGVGDGGGVVGQRGTAHSENAALSASPTFTM